jgi:hypothetical protein
MRGSEVLEVERAQHIIDVFSLMQGKSATLGVASELDAQVPGEGARNLELKSGGDGLFKASNRLW